MPKVFSDRITIGSIDFNTEIEDANGTTWYCDGVDGWEDSPDVRTPGSDNGYTDGIQYGDYFPVYPRVIECTGVVVTDTRENALIAWRQLQRVFANSLNITVTRYGPFNEQMVVRRTSVLRKVKDLGHAFRFSATLTAPWPYKVSLTSKTASAGPYAGADYLRDYPREYPLVYDMIEGEGVGGGAVEVTLVNEGTATAYPILVINGPLTGNTWYVRNELTGKIMGFKLNIGAGQVLTINTLNQTATLGSEEVDYFITGDWLSMPPGEASVFRLITEEPALGANITVTMKDTWS